MSESISIYFTRDGKAWADFLYDKLNSEGYNITTKLKDFETASAEVDTKVNVFFITPDFIQLENWNLMNYFDSTTSLAVLTGISCDDWSFAIQEFNLDSLSEWYFQELLADNLDDSVRDLIVLIISLYENIENTAIEPEEYVNVESLSPPKKKESVIPTVETPKGLSSQDNKDERTEEVVDIESENKTDAQEDIYASPSSIARPVETVRYVFRQGDYVFVLLEDTNHGLVQVKFHDDKTVVTAACVSEKTTVYSFQHKRTGRETFDVTLDGIEIGHGTVENSEDGRPCSDFSECSYDFPRFARDSVVSTTSGSSSVSSRSSGTSLDRPPPCSNRPTGSQYINTPTKSYSDSEQPSDVKFSLPSSPLTHESPKSWASSNRDTLTESPGPLSKLDHIQKLLEDVTDPVSVLCQSLQAENVKRLDEKLTSMLQASETLKHLSFKTSLNVLPDKSNTVCPTLLHFGAKYNLKIFCKFLLDNSITRNCARKRNRDGDYPHDIARREGHDELAKMLERCSLDLRFDGKKGSHDSGISQCTGTPAQSPMSPPPVRDSLDNLYMDMSFGRPPSEQTDSNKSRKSSMKKSSQGSLQDGGGDYEYLSQNAEEEEFKNLNVTLGPPVYIADEENDEKTPVPSESLDPPFDVIPRREIKEDKFDGRESNGIENPHLHKNIDRTSSEEFRTNRKELKSFFGIQPSASAPSEIHLQQPKKQGRIGRIFGIKDKARTLSNPKLTAEAMNVIQGQPHIGQKTHVFRRDLIESDPSSVQFRERLQTYPGPDEVLKRPDLKHLKAKHKLSKNQSSSFQDLVATGVESPISPLARTPSPCGGRSGIDTADSPFQRAQYQPAKPSSRGHGASDMVTHSPKEKEGSKRDKKSYDKKDKNKKKVDLTITAAQKRKSMRLNYARQDPFDAAPPLPPRPPPNQKLLGSL